MREIKFRAWYQDYETNEWAMLEWFPSFFADTSPVTGYGNEFPDGDDVKLMQFTGLQDKNGKEIYEGDICRNGDYEPDAHAYNYRIEQVRYIDDEGAFHGWNYNLDGMTCEVIGNIYENPELLEVAK